MTDDIAPILDHVVVNARDALDDATASWRGLGFFLTEPSRHTLGSINRTAVFAQDYLELVGIDRDAPTPRQELLRSPLGLEGLVFRTADADALHAELRRRGVAASPPVAFSRPVALDDAVAEARFRVVRLGATAAPFGRCYFCQHLTPELVWRDAWRRHPNGALGIARVVIAASDPAAQAQHFRGIFGAAVAGLRLHLADANIEIVSLDEAGAARDAIVALDLRVHALDDAARVFAEAGVATSRAPHRIDVSQNAAFAARLGFVAD